MTTLAAGAATTESGDDDFGRGLHRRPSSLPYSIEHRTKICKAKGPPRGWAFALAGCLTMTYFRMGIHTIIGAPPFHGPVRDGKGWFQRAKVVRR